TIRHRHATYYAAFAERAEEGLLGESQTEWLHDVDADHDNIRAALEWCDGHSGRVEMGLRIAGAMWRYWLIRGRLRAEKQILERLLASADAGISPYTHAKAMNVAGVLAYAQGEYGQARAWQEAALQIQRAHADGA